VDVAPKQKTTPRQRIAQLVRLFSTAVRGERASAWQALVRTMDSENISWSDVGNWIEHGGAKCTDGKYTEAEMGEFGQVMRAEGVEAGIKIGMARAGNGGGNGQLTLPKPAEMAEYCHQRAGQLKDDKQRDFISDMRRITRGLTLSRSPLSRPRLGYLISIYVQMGGRI
jgi:hypothetical protein